MDTYYEDRINIIYQRRIRQCLEEMERDRRDRVREQAGEWVEGEARAEVQAQALAVEAVWAAEAVPRHAREDTAYVRNAEKRPFIRRGRPAIISCAPSAAQP